MKKVLLSTFLLSMMILSLMMGSQFTASAAPVAQAGTLSLTTDFADYIPGAFVNLSGANWQPGESVYIFVNDDVGQTWSYNSSPDPVVDGSGNFAIQFQLPNWFVATYTVTGTGTVTGIVT